jgi:amino acid transporter
VGRLAIVLTAGTLTTVAIVIVSGLANFDRSLLTLPPDAFRLDIGFFKGLGLAMTIAIYDYLGYYNICHLGEEVREPGKTIPRAVIVSVVLVASIYLTMNLSIIAVVPWQRAIDSQYIASEFMERLYGRPVAVAFTALILWTVVACVYVMTLGYSRIPFAAARQGDFFRPFAYVHPRGRFPLVSLAALGLLVAGFCFFELNDVIQAAVTVRIAVAFIGQIVALHLLRTTRPDVPLPFRMWLYPLPSLLALGGWVFVLCFSDLRILALSGGVLASGVVAYFAWRWWRGEEGV